MRSSPIILPALGEGIREARVLSLLKEEGEKVMRDVPIAEVETDKATLVIESPACGVIDRWLVRAGELYPVGTLMTSILENGHAALETPSVPIPGSRNRRISPRVRAWCLSQGIDPDTLSENLATGPQGRLAVADIERWRRANISLEPAGPMIRETGFVTAAIERHVNWTILDATAQELGATTSEFAAWCIFRAMERRGIFRSVAEPRAPNAPGRPILGVAVALLRDGLAVSAIGETPPNDAMAFFAAFRRAVSTARSKDRPDSLCSVVFSDMSSFGVRSATPIVVPPSLATLFIGAPFPVPVPSPDGVTWALEAKLVLAFNHCRINGAGAARFLRDVHRIIGGGVKSGKFANGY